MGERVVTPVEEDGHVVGRGAHPHGLARGALGVLPDPHVVPLGEGVVLLLEHEVGRAALQLLPRDGRHTVGAPRDKRDQAPQSGTDAQRPGSGPARPGESLHYLRLRAHEQEVGDVGVGAVLCRLRAERHRLDEGGEGGVRGRQGHHRRGLLDFQGRLQREGQFDPGRIVDRSVLHRAQGQAPDQESSDRNRRGVGGQHREGEEGRGQAPHGPEPHDAAVLRHRLSRVFDRGDARVDGQRDAVLIDHLREVEPQACAAVLLPHVAHGPADRISGREQDPPGQLHRRDEDRPDPFARARGPTGHPGG